MKEILDCTVRSFEMTIFSRDLLTVNRYSCEDCEASYATNAALIFHRELKHEQVEKVSCHICKKSYPHQSYLKLHLKRHQEGENGIVHLCSDCDYKTNIKKYLMVHIRKKHK